MRNMRKTVLALLAATTLPGCATMLTSEHSREYQNYQAKGLAVAGEESYGRRLPWNSARRRFLLRPRIWLGCLQSLVWPLSVLWDPVSGYEGSETINYYATKASVDAKVRKELGNLDDQMTVGVVNKEQYVQQKHAIESRYSVD